MPRKPGKPAEKVSKTQKKRAPAKAKKPRKTKEMKILEESLTCKFLEIKGFRKGAIKVDSLPLGTEGYCLHPKALQEPKATRNIICVPYSTRGKRECPYGGAY